MYAIVSKPSRGTAAGLTAATPAIADPRGELSPERGRLIDPNAQGGDILIQRGNWAFNFPLATSLLVSVRLTLLFSFFNRR